MMLGTLAQRGAPAQGTPPWVPDDANGFLDFANAQYFVSGAERTIASLLGGDFDIGAISALGMRVTPSNGNRPKAIGVLRTSLIAGLAAGSTILYDISSAIDPSGFLMFFGDTDSLGTADDGIIISADGGISDFIGLSLFPSPVTGSGAHKIAITLNRDIGGGDYEYAWSNDGSAAETATVWYAAPALSEINIGHDGAGTGNSLNDIYIRSITTYPALLPAALPALTA